MSWMSGELVVFALAIITLLGVGYSKTKKASDPEAARKEFVYKITFVFSLIALLWILPFFWAYSWAAFNFAYFALVILAIGSWRFRKRKAGALLADFGRPGQNKSFLQSGLFGALMALLITVLLLLSSYIQSSSMPNDVARLTVISFVFFCWASAIFNIAVGMSKLEFCNQGICYMFSVVKWRKVISYTWESGKPEVLMLKIKPLLPILPARMGIPISESQKDRVIQILNDRLSDKIV
jgi:hypothetical protein